MDGQCGGGDEAMPRLPPRDPMPSAHLRSVRRSIALLLLLGLAPAGCTARRAPDDATPRVVVRDTLWYVSARQRDRSGRDRRALADSLEYGAVIVDRAPARDPIADPLHFTRRDSLRLPREAFLDAVRERLATQRVPDDFLVLYVHGFGTGLDECWQHPLHARTRAGATVPWLAFCWPSHGSGVAWPRPGAIFVRAYEDDTAAVAASAPAFRRTLRDVVRTVGAEHVLVAAHSLGGRMVAETLAESLADASAARAADAFDGGRLRALTLLALDHDAARFGDTLLPTLRDRASRVVLYTARRDRALGISHRIHDTPRAGLAEPTALVRPGLETVDATDAFATEGLLQRLFGNRHTVRRATGLLWDLTHIVGRGFAPECRAVIGTGERDTTGVWHLLDMHPPDPARLEACAAAVPGHPSPAPSHPGPDAPTVHASSPR